MISELMSFADLIEENYLAGSTATYGVRLALALAVHNYYINWLIEKDRKKQHRIDIFE